MFYSGGLMAKYLQGKQNFGGNVFHSNELMGKVHLEEALAPLCLWRCGREQFGRFACGFTPAFGRAVNSFGVGVFWHG
jgi:hypothetical protein